MAWTGCPPRTPSPECLGDSLTSRRSSWTSKREMTLDPSTALTCRWGCFGHSQGSDPRPFVTADP